jgi:hypothetical protein
MSGVLECVSKKAVTKRDSFRVSPETLRRYFIAFCIGFEGGVDYVAFVGYMLRIDPLGKQIDCQCMSA